MTQAVGEKYDNVLCLNWNTILFQSYGFIQYMKESGLDDGPIRRLSDLELKIFLLQYGNRHISEIFDSNISEKEFYDFIHLRYTDISNRSPDTYLLYLTNVIQNQGFVRSFYIASISECIIPNRFETKHKHVIFDIFDISKIEDFINTHNITTLFVHDIRIVHDLVFNFNIDVTGFTFIVSKLGYNFVKDENGGIDTRCPDLLEVKESLGFELGYLDLYEFTEEDFRST